MARIPSRFVEIVQQLKEDKQPRRATVRNVLKWFNAERRGANVVAEVEQALQLAGLRTDPPFAQVGMDELLRFVLQSATASIHTESPTPSPVQVQPPKSGSVPVDEEEVSPLARDTVDPTDGTDLDISELEMEEVSNPVSSDDQPVSSHLSDGTPTILSTENNDQPIVGGQTTAQNEAVETVLKRLEEGEIFVPSYQRDSDEWDDTKKSLLWLPPWAMQIDLKS